MAEDETDPHSGAIDEENAPPIEEPDGGDEATGEGEAGAGDEGPDAEDADGEEEEPEEEPEEEDESTQAAGSSIDSKMRIEVDLLTYQTVKKIADKIAAAVAAKVNGGRVVLASADAAAALGPALLLQKELEGLADGLDRLLPQEQEEALESFVATSVAALTTTTGEIGKLVTSLAGIAGKIAVTETYSARSVGIDESTLLTVLAGRLAAKGIEVFLIADIAPFASFDVPALKRIVDALGTLRLGADEATVKALEKVEKAIAPLREGRSVPLQAQRLLAIIGEAVPPALLTARSLAAGGRYLERSHLFTKLGLVDKLSFSAGAAVHYALYRMPAGTIVASDIVMGGSGKTKMPATSQLFDPDNL
ncbi:MAG TPA: hypothetical protein VI168_01720 [Croceibacterium sp.]